jgi:hypothetical protein
MWPAGKTRAQTKFKRGKLNGEIEFFDQSGERFELWCGEYKLHAGRWSSGEPRSRGLTLDGPHRVAGSSPGRLGHRC